MLQCILDFCDKVFGVALFTAHESNLLKNTTSDAKWKKQGQMRESLDNFYSFITRCKDPITAIFQQMLMIKFMFGKHFRDEEMRLLIFK